jgi:ABC-type uncharacterized transport system substrate-binding protein
LRELGYIEGQSITIEFRRAAGKVDRLPELAEELVRLKAEVIVARATPAVQAAKNATTTIPIVMMGVADAVGERICRQPGTAGREYHSDDQHYAGACRKEIGVAQRNCSKALTRGLFGLGRDPAHKLFVKEAQQAAEGFGMKFQPLVITAPEEIEGAFSTMIRERAGALVVQPLFIAGLGQGQRIAGLAVKNRLPTVSDGYGFPEAGGLMLYGPDPKQLSRRAATFVDKILKGTKPADLPVEQPTKFEFVINLKTAKALNLTIPQSVLFRADRVIK